jgi:acetylornithine/N-succinyldiaminopimelate aminotransferase
MPTRPHYQLTETSRQLVEQGYKYFVPNYKPREMILEQGKGSRIWDKDGQEYIDLGAGIAVSALGHQHPRLTRALHAQADKLWHTSNVYFSEPTVHLAKALVESSNFATRVLFSNSGAEANEGAIKLARKHAANQGRPPEAREIVTFKGSFHGRTLAAVTATAQPKYQEGFEPIPGGFVYADAINDTAAVDRVVSEKTCAIMVEPVQGEGGIKPCSAEFLQYLRKKCDEVGAILMLDQVQCGMMRTGKLFSHWFADIKPDTVSLAKALGCGFPIGALLTGPKVAEVLEFGTHGSTFGGNPMASAVALEALNILQSGEIEANVTARNEQLISTLNALNEELNIFTEIRGKGLMIGAELTPNLHGKAGELMEHARLHGVLILVAGPNVMRFLPPLNISEEEMAAGLDRLAAALRHWLETNG